MSMPDIESARIITVSTAHLHPETIDMIEKEKGDLPEGPSIAIREEGYLVNSHHGDADALRLDLSEGLFLPLHERAPDLVLLRALARGLKADWINIDRDGPEYSKILPSYGSGGFITPPSDSQWREALSEVGQFPSGAEIVRPSLAVLSMIEAGQTPYAYLSREVLLDFPAFREGKIKLINAPAGEARHGKAEEWVAAYGGMVSYESALDAAGYERESEMREADAPVFVTLARIHHDGSVQVQSQVHGTLTATADAVYAAHGIDLSSLDEVPVGPEV